jgi:hypothetical protein
MIITQTGENFKNQLWTALLTVKIFYVRSTAAFSLLLWEIHEYRSILKILKVDVQSLHMQLIAWGDWPKSSEDSHSRKHSVPQAFGVLRVLDFSIDVEISTPPQW